MGGMAPAQCEQCASRPMNSRSFRRCCALAAVLFVCSPASSQARPIKIESVRAPPSLSSRAGAPSRVRKSAVWKWGHKVALWLVERMRRPTISGIACCRPRRKAADRLNNLKRAHFRASDPLRADCVCVCVCAAERIASCDPRRWPQGLLSRGWPVLLRARPAPRAQRKILPPREITN